MQTKINPIVGFQRLSYNLAQHRTVQMEFIYLRRVVGAFLVAFVVTSTAKSLPVSIVEGNMYSCNNNIKISKY